jgi:hypothetical protein
MDVEMEPKEAKKPTFTTNGKPYDQAPARRKKDGVPDWRYAKNRVYFEYKSLV